jgi:hypothetical protein
MLRTPVALVPPAVRGCRNTWASIGIDYDEHSVISRDELSQDNQILVGYIANSLRLSGGLSRFDVSRRTQNQRNHH